MAVLTNETWSGATAFWHELPRTLTAGVVTLVAALPLTISLLYEAPRWLSAAAVLPVMLALTGVASFCGFVARGDAPSLSSLRHVDPFLALLLTAAAAPALLTPWGAVPAAAALIVGPFALAYGAVRARTGLAALRGGLILAAYRPAWSLTLTALSILTAFASAATTGVLAVIAAPLLLTITCRQTQSLLTEIDTLQHHPTPTTPTALTAAGHAHAPNPTTPSPLDRALHPAQVAASQGGLR